MKTTENAESTEKERVPLTAGVIGCAIEAQRQTFKKRDQKTGIILNLCVLCALCGYLLKTEGNTYLNRQ